MKNTTRDFVRSRPRPTAEEALGFARSVMVEKGLDIDNGYGPYKLADGMTLKLAKAALEKHTVDASEHMALEMAEYAWPAT